MALTRRSFLSTVSSGVAALGALGMGIAPVRAQLVYQRADWKFSEFEKLLKAKARARQVWDVKPIGEGMFLNGIKNSLNGFHFGFDVPAAEIKIVAAMHGPANTLNFDDAMWEKYRIGEWLHVTDQKTGKPATRNVYYPQKAGASNDPEERGSTFQDTSIEALRGRGVQFLSCHTATEEQAKQLVEQYSLKASAEEVVKDLQTHTVPGVLIVPAMVASIALLQSDGHYTYITV